jgi:KipI family sensor histidine kinase inhibitor
MSFRPEIIPLGDSAVLIRLGDEIDLKINVQVHQLAALLAAFPLEGIVETVPAYSTLLIHYDPLALAWADVRGWLGGKLEQLGETRLRAPRRHEVLVHYGGDYGVDLGFVAEHHHLPVEEVIRIHSETVYTVYMMGFTPGFPYMGKVSDAINTPRLETPRLQVAAGTVAIAGAQTGIYPIDSPGGWRLIGRTSFQIFDPQSSSPFLFFPGDEVQFRVQE